MFYYYYFVLMAHSLAWRHHFFLYGARLCYDISFMKLQVTLSFLLYLLSTLIHICFVSFIFMSCRAITFGESGLIACGYFFYLLWLFSPCTYAFLSHHAWQFLFSVIISKMWNMDMFMVTLLHLKVMAHMDYTTPYTRPYFTQHSCTLIKYRFLVSNGCIWEK